MSQPRILIIDDEPLMRISIADALKAEGYQVKVAATGPEGVDFIKKEQFDIIVSDLRLPGLDGLQVLQTCREVSPRTGVIVITAHGSVETAVEAMKIGAYDYITKPFSMDELLLIVKRLVKMLELEDENRSLREELEGRFSFKGILSKNEKMREVLETIKLVAPSDSTILIVGESGTGKEVVANAIHHNSPRREGPFIRVSCAALPPSLMDTELFGHEKGAFTGALRQRKGRFELANHGTLFLDEIGEISPVLQAKLLRVLQDRQFERVGGTATVEVDVRLVCATQRDLKKEVQAGKFREDLYHRLSVAPLYLLPLRERKEDVLLLAEHFLERLGNRMGKRRRSLSEPAKGMVARYSFPGNVRELENTIERAVSLSNHEGNVEPWDLCGFPSCPYLGGLPQPTCGFCREDTHLMAAEHGARVEDLSAAREQFERQHILKVLERTRDNKTEAARILGVSRKALWEKCKRYGISKGTNGVEED
jgi:DNA-binding NtrC family response regulator